MNPNILAPGFTIICFPLLHLFNSNRVFMDTLYLVGEVEAHVLKSPLSDLVVGNVFRALVPFHLQAQIEEEGIRKLIRIGPIVTMCSQT